MVDDHAVILAGIRVMLDAYDNISIVGGTGQPDELFALIETKDPNVILMDVALNGSSGVELARTISDRWPRIGILAFSTHSERHTISGMLAAGALGFVHKSASAEEISEGIFQVAQRQTYLCQKSRDIVVRDYAAQSSKSFERKHTRLTKREIEVARYLALGLSAKEVAAKLGISKNTIDTHRSKIMNKLDTNSLADVTRFAIREGMVSAEDG